MIPEFDWELLSAIAVCGNHCLHRYFLATSVETTRRTASLCRYVCTSERTKDQFCAIATKAALTAMAGAAIAQMQIDQKSTNARTTNEANGSDNAFTVSRELRDIREVPEFARVAGDKGAVVGSVP